MDILRPSLRRAHPDNQFKGTPHGFETESPEVVSL